jgi:hypothetical protein
MHWLLRLTALFRRPPKLCHEIEVVWLPIVLSCHGMIVREHRQSPRCTQPDAPTQNLVMHAQSLERAAPSEKGNPGRWVGTQ